jgi:hypothetical protein
VQHKNKLSSAKKEKSAFYRDHSPLSNDGSRTVTEEDEQSSGEETKTQVQAPQASKQ